jgi:hypothetical protein
MNHPMHSCPRACASALALALTLGLPACGSGSASTDESSASHAKTAPGMALEPHRKFASAQGGVDTAKVQIVQQNYQANLSASK